MRSSVRLLGKGMLRPLALAWAAVAAPGALAAQTAPTSAAWALDTLRSGFCVDFLVDPKLATRGVFRDAQVVPASQADSLHFALRRAIADAPQFATWIPQRFCLYQFAAVRIGATELRDRKHGRAQAVGVWSAATAPGTRKPVVLLVSNSRMASSVRRLGIAIDVFRSAFGKVPESTDDQYEIRYDRSVVTWAGHASGDSTGAAAVDRSWTVPGRLGRAYAVRMTLGPSGSRRLAGGLRVEGKGELAQALAGSPIRFVGPVVWGSSGEISFLP